jgi:hypothetical protein
MVALAASVALHIAVVAETPGVAASAAAAVVAGRRATATAAAPSAKRVAAAHAVHVARIVTSGPGDVGTSVVDVLGYAPARCQR